MKNPFALSLLCFLTVGRLFFSCVVDNGDRPKTVSEESTSDPGSGPFDCAADDAYEFEMLDNFEFGAALGTWYANNEICEGCQALADQRTELMDAEADAGDEDTAADALAQVAADFKKCKEYCRDSQFPTIFDKPLPAGVISGGGRCGSAFAFHLTTKKELTDWGANWGTRLSPPFDGSDWEGISFWARRSPAGRGTVRVEMADKFTDGEYTDKNGNSFCNSDYTDDTVSQGCDRFGGYVSVGTDWKFFTVPFEDLRQAGWGISAPYFDVAGLRSLTFLFPAGNWDIWIDDVAFYKQRSN